MIGKSIAHYTIKEKIGAGGMGDVYRASDSRLGRDVALKVLPEEFARDADRMARFEREAHLLASLNHPNIATIHGLEEKDGIRCLVMELVEGETLAERVGRGPVPAVDLLPVALQIAEALDAAHDKGIIHRDLKAANIMITPEGRVKVLDFGLAKAFDEEPETSTNLSLSPTMTAAATRAGVILGTAAYMSPEQARGNPVDKRTDIWAFGCVLMEALTGKQPFAGATISDTLAAVLKTEPAWDSLPAGTSRRLALLLRRCLDKEPKTRLRDIGEAWIVLRREMNGEPDEGAGEAKSDAIAPHPATSTRAIATAVLLTAVATAALIWGLRGSSPAPQLKKFELRPINLQVGYTLAPAISPDATKLVYIRDGKLFLRDLRQVEDVEIPDSTGAVRPCWSPASDAIAYAREDSLWKYSLASGQSTLISSQLGVFSAAAGLSWGTDDQLVFSRGTSGLLQVSARGGEPHEILAIDPETEGDLHQPRFLPEGRGLLYVPHRIETGPDTIKVLSGGDTKIIIQQPSQIIWNPVYSPTGHILYARRTTNIGLWAVPFSLERLEVTGDPFLVDREGSAPSVADDGTLFYVRGAGAGTQQLVWIDLQGELGETIGQPQAAMMKPAISPDGRRVAVMGLENESWDIWVHDATRGTRTRLTFDPRREWDPAWTPDGRNIVFWDAATRALSSKAADGTGDTRRMFTADFPDSGQHHLSPDGRSMVFWARTADSGEDIWLVSLEGENEPIPLIATPDRVEHPRISPDGRFLVYASNESGRVEVFLTRFPDTKAGKWQVSVNGGRQPRWGAKGKAIYYQQGAAIMAADFSAAPAVQFGTPRALDLREIPGVSILNTGEFDVAPDGSRIVVIRDLIPEGMTPALIVVQNWASEFEQGD